jgi:tetratricopeptide (TPR) repeat protein
MRPARRLRQKRGVEQSPDPSPRHRPALAQPTPFSRLHSIASLDTVLSPPLNACGITLRKQGRLDEADAMLQRAIEAYEASVGKDHASTGIGLKALADLRVDQGRLEDAEQLMVRSLAILGG